MSLGVARVGNAELIAVGVMVLTDFQAVHSLARICGVGGIRYPGDAFGELRGNVVKLAAASAG